MNEENELEKLVIKNLEIVEQSRKLIHGTIDSEFKRKLESLLVPQLEYLFPGCVNEFYLFTRDCAINVYAPTWYYEKTDAWCLFSVDFLEWERYKKVFSYLAFCTNLENVTPGIFFESNKKFHNKFSVDWEKEIGELYNRGKNQKRLDAAGFMLKDNRLYRPFQLEPATISEDWPNLTTDSIKPLLDAFKSVSEVMDIFDGLVKRLTGQK